MTPASQAPDTNGRHRGAGRNGRPPPRADCGAYTATVCLISGAVDTSIAGVTSTLTFWVFGSRRGGTGSRISRTPFTKLAVVASAIAPSGSGIAR